MKKSRKLHISIIALISLFLFLNPRISFTQTNSLFEMPLSAGNMGVGGVSIIGTGRFEGHFSDTDDEKDSRRGSITSLYTNQFDGLHYAAVDCRAGNLGVTYRRLRSEVITGRNLQGKPTGGDFHYVSQGLVGRLTRSFGPATAELKSRILHKSMEKDLIGASLSPGFVYEASPIGFKMEFSNILNGKISPPAMNSKLWKKELTFGVGFEYENLKAGFDMEAELHDRGVEPNGFRFGAEWWIAGFAAVRLGIMDDLRHTIGWGFRGKDIRLDYAYLWHGELPNNNFVSISWYF